MLKRFAPGNLSTEIECIITCKMNQRATIHSIYVCNTHSGGVEFTLHHMPSGGIPGINNVLYEGYSVSSGQTLIIKDPIYLEPGDCMVAKAGSDNHLCIFVYADVVDQ